MVGTTSRTGPTTRRGGLGLLCALVTLTAMPALGGGEADTPEAVCPVGFEALGEFKLTAYVLAREEQFAPEPVVVDPCGLRGEFSEAFLFGSGVRMQGSGRARDGSLIHYAGKGCFEVLDCPRTASGRCATVGRTVAVDRVVVPLGSTLWVEGLGHRVAEDVGGGIRGNHLDVWYGDELTMTQAYRQTRHGRKVCMASR